MRKINLLLIILMMAPIFQGHARLGHARQQYQLKGTVVNQDGQPLEDVFGP